MKNSVLIIILSIVLFSSCKKKHETPVESPQEVKTPDDIFYKDFAGSNAFQSMRSFTTYYTVCNITVPIPRDSEVVYDLDMNSDQVADFHFKATHWKDTGTTYCGHCYGGYNYVVTVFGSLPGDSIAAELSSESFAVISQSLKWVPGNALSLHECANSWDFGEGYIPVKVGKSFGYIHIKPLTDKNGIQILDFALNKTSGNSILCGQKK